MIDQVDRVWSVKWVRCGQLSVLNKVGRVYSNKWVRCGQPNGSGVVS